MGSPAVVKNPLKKATSFFKKTPRRKGLGLNPNSLSSDRTEIIWPPGTWTLPYRNISLAECDFLAQCTLLDCYTLELSLEYERTFGMKAGGMAGSNAMASLPPDWLPSEASMKELFRINKWDVNFMHYYVARLDSIGHLRP